MTTPFCLFHDKVTSEEREGWTRAKYWLVRPGAASASVTLPELLAACSPSPGSADAVRLLAPGETHVDADGWRATRLGGL